METWELDNIFFLSALKLTKWLFSKVAVTPTKRQKKIPRGLSHLDRRSAEADETRAMPPTEGKTRIGVARQTNPTQHYVTVLCMLENQKSEERRKYFAYT